MSSAVPTIGFLVGTTYHAWQDYIQAFEMQLGTTYGWKKGTDFNIEYQAAAGQKSSTRRSRQILPIPKGTLRLMSSLLEELGLRRPA